MSASDLIDQLDDLLRDDRMDTSAGLHFLGELVKDAFKYIDEQRQKYEQDTDMMRSFATRIGNVEKGLNDFLTKREKEQDTAKDERTFYRRAVVGGIIVIVLNELARWFLT